MVHELGFPTCFLSHGQIHRQLHPGPGEPISRSAGQVPAHGNHRRSRRPASSGVELHAGACTIGLVPPKTRAARIDALRQASDFAKQLGIPQVQTHCGFIPENPGDPLYPQAVEAIRTVAKHCQGNGQDFLMETGQETPTTMSRAIHDVGHAQPWRRPRHRQPAALRQSQPGRCGRHPRSPRPQRPCQRRPLAHRPLQVWRRGSYRQRPGGFPRRSSPNFIVSATPAPSPLSAKPLAPQQIEDVRRKNLISNA